MADITNKEAWELFRHLKETHGERIDKNQRMRQIYTRKEEDLQVYITDVDGNRVPAKSVMRPLGTNTVNIGKEILTATPMQINVPPSGESRAAYKKSQKTENFIRAFWHAHNSQLGRSLPAGMIFHAFLYGEFMPMVLPLLDPDQRKKGKLPIIVRLINPEQAYPYWDVDGLRTAFVIGEMQAGYIKRNYPIDRIISTVGGTDIPDEEFVEWVEMYDDESKQYFAEGNPVWKDGPIPHKFGFNPAVWGWGRSVEIPEADQVGQSILQPMESILHWANVVATIKAMSGLGYSNDAIVLEEGQQGVPEDWELDLRPFAVNRVPSGSSIRWLQRDRVPADIDDLQQIAQMDIELTGWPSVVVGQAPFQQAAAAALTLLTHSGRLHSVDYQNNVQFALEQVNERILRSVEALDEPIEIAGTAFMDRGERGTIFKYGPKDVGGYYVNQVRLVPDLPTDKAAQAQIFNALTQGPNPAIGVEAARADILKRPDPARDGREIAREKIKNAVVDAVVEVLIPQFLQVIVQRKQQEETEKDPLSARLGGPEPGRMTSDVVPPAPGSVVGSESPGPQEVPLPANIPGSRSR